jgi:ferrous iron transport protein B
MRVSTQARGRIAVAPAPRIAPQVVVVGEENVGKTQLVSAITGRPSHAENFAGSTVSCDIYNTREFDFVDTPGILFKSDTETTRLAVQQIRENDLLLVVIKAAHFDKSFQLLKPLMTGKRAIIVLTFRDKVADRVGLERLLVELNTNLGIRTFAVDSRRLADHQRQEIFLALAGAKKLDPIERAPMAFKQAASAPRRLSALLFSPPIAALVLLAPALLVVMMANRFAAAIEPSVQDAIQPAIDMLASAPSLIHEILVGRYGLLTMGPLMFVWALPTVILYAFTIGAYKASGLLDRLTVGIHPLTRPFGLNGRDVVRVLMGFGCNVPAVISTRACSGCSRDACVSAIAFGSACSYQLGATLAVFAATQNEYLVLPYLFYLVVTTLVFIRIISSPVARSTKNELLLTNDSYLQFPTPTAIWRECRTTIFHFLRRALPIFLGITLLASILDWAGVIEAIGRAVGPAMAIFRLPQDTIVPILMASIRKDGILLLAGPDLAKTLSAGQILVSTYLAGVLLPCLVTFITVIRERSPRFAIILITRQVVAALFFSVALAWAVYLLGF